MNPDYARATRVADAPPEFSTGAQNPLRLRCPVCGHSGDSMIVHGQSQTEPECRSCGFCFENRGGIWRGIAPMREQNLRQFILDYATVRSRESRGAANADYYLALPFRDLSGRHVWQWKIRGKSFGFLAGHILPHLEFHSPGGLDVLDIGAGNCWLSYRLAERRHRPVAIDLSVSISDGLGAAARYFPHLGQPFPLFQAEMDRLPFDNSQFDMAIFNSSFHYSTDYNVTLREALRCLRRPGHLLIIDSPCYSKYKSGMQMAEERHRQFEKEYGFRSDSLRTQDFLTPASIDELGRRHGLEWTILKPWYGLGWALRPLKAWLLKRREPSKFCILWAQVG